MSDVEILNVEENDSPPSEPSEPPSEKPSESESQQLLKMMQQTLTLLQQTIAAMASRVEQIEGVQQQQSEKLTAALEEATELASVYREQINQFDSTVQKLVSLQAREERQLAVLVKLVQADQEA